MPDVEASYCLESEGKGVSLGEGEREGSAPQETGKISSQYSAKAGTTWAGMRKTNQVGCDGGLAGTE